MEQTPNFKPVYLAAILLVVIVLAILYSPRCGPQSTQSISEERLAEQSLLRYINSERASRDLEPLIFDEKLAEIARNHSRDMLTRGYFGHRSPEGVDHEDRLRAANIVYFTARANIIAAYTLEDAHRSLMYSPGQRKAILSPESRKVGIGVCIIPETGEIVVTQLFVD